MLTYDDVVHAPLGPLKSAVDDWSEMVTKLEKLADDARGGMKAKSDRADWQGVNAGVTKPFIARTAKEFDDAAAQAKGIRLLLAEAHTAFKSARDALVRIRDEEGPAAGIRVDVHGRARHVLDGEAARHDPDDPTTPQERATREAAVAAWQKRIDRLVEDCADADDSLRRALAANVTDDHNFTAPRHKSLDAEQASRAADLMRKVTGGGGTARNVAELKELEDLLDDNRNDAEFSADFYRRLGAEGTLEAYAGMSLDSTSLGPAGQDRVAMVRNIQGDMGAILGLATQPSTPNHLDATWTTQLLKAGRKEMDVSRFTAPGTSIHGYQALGALLREGTYDKDFLVHVGRDLVAMDKANPGVWNQNLPHGPGMAINLDENGGKGFNPLTGLMEAMSRHPDASAAFFDEPLRSDTNKDGIVTLSDAAIKGKDAQSIVDHMLDRKPTDDWYDTTVTGDRHPGLTAMGKALEAAVTGRDPGDEDAPPVSHSRTMSSVMEKVVAKIGDDPELVTGKPGEPGPLNTLSQRFGNMAAEYMPDLQATAENGAGQIKPFGEAAEFEKGSMALFLGAVAQDPQAYGAITHAQQAYTTALVSEVFHNPDRFPDAGEGVRNAVHPGGEIAGMMTEARAQAIHDTKAHEAEEFNKGVEDNAKWTNRVIDAVGGKYVEMIPVGGDVIMWIKEDITESAVENAKDDRTMAGKRESASAYGQAEEAAKRSAADAVHRAARGAGLTLEEIEQHKGSASTQMGSAHAIGHSLIASTNP